MDPKTAPGSQGEWQHAALWRRGMMHAVERLDLIFDPNKPIPKRQMGATLAAIRDALDEITEFQRRHMPRSYEEAFDLCKTDYDAARARRRDARGQP